MPADGRETVGSEGSPQVERQTFTEEWLVAVLDSLDEGVISFDADGRILAANPSAERLLGFRIGRVRGQLFTELGWELVDATGKPLPPEQDPIVATLQTREPRRQQQVGLALPGGMRWLSVSMQVLPASACHERSDIVGSFIDISNKVRTQEALHRRVEFEDLLARVSSRFVAAPPEAVEDEIQQALAELGSLAEVDCGAALLFAEGGRRVNRVLLWKAPGFSIAPMRPASRPDDLAWMMRHLRRNVPVVIGSPADIPAEAPTDRAGLDRLGVRALLAVPMISQGALIGCTAFAHASEREWSADQISNLRLLAEVFTNALDRRRANLELARATDELRQHAETLERMYDELRRADELKRDFMSMTSHELRTPLASLIGFSDVLVASWATLSEREQRGYVAAIGRQGRHLYRLVDDVLVALQLQSGTVSPRVEPVVVADLVDVALDGLPDAKGVSVDVPAALAVLIDRDHGRRMVVNLVENALKYGRPPVIVDARADGEVVEIEVIDHGPGVAPSFIPHLFEMFSQASTGITRSATGTGLGLAIVQGLATLNAGEVRYEPNQPNGARFTVRLRRAPAEQAAAVPASQRAGEA